MSTLTAEEQAARDAGQLRALPPDPTAGGALRRLARGVVAALSGIGLVLSDARLLVLSLIPMAIHVLLFGAILGVGVTYAVDPVVAWLGPSGPAGEGFFASAGHAVWAVAVNILVWVLVIGLSVVSALVVGSIVCDPFYDALSERTEELHVGHPVGEPFSVAVVAGIGRELTATILRLTIYIAVAIPLWLLSLTPAAVVATPLGLLWTWLFFAYEFLARPMARHAPVAGDRMKALFGHKALFVGFGVVAWALSFIPLTAPLLVVAATRLYLTLAADDAAPSGMSPQDREILRARAGRR